MSVPPFSLTTPRYDLNTFSGRFRYFLDITDPRTLATSRERLAHCQHVLKMYKDKGAKLVNDEEMWQCKKVVDSIVHPVTEEIIPSAFRMSAIAPLNIPLVYFMLTARGMPAQLFLQWLNQTYNSACNYYNRSGADISWRALAEAYGLAVVASCSLAYGFGQLVLKGPPIFRQAGVLIPLVAVAAANISNVALTRKSEITDGVPVTTASGDVVGVSQKAGAIAVGQTAVSRGALVPMAVLLLPPVIMGGLHRIKALPANPRAKLIIELGVIYGCLQAALPATIALFPQQATFNPNDLEPSFHGIKDKNGQVVTKLYANKGL